MRKNSKIGLAFLVASLCCNTFATPVLSADLGEEKLYSKSNPAVFNGTTEITVPVGTKVDLGETEYRIFANDFEDGDCTQNIKIISSNYKDAAGVYQVTYEVTDSDRNVSVETVNIRVEDRADKVIERTLYTLPKLSNMDLVGTHRGNNHDRQNIGLYLKAGEQIQIRQTNPEFAKDLKLSLDTDDSKTGKAHKIPKEGGWVTITAEYDCVPSIMTPKDAASQPVIEIKYGNDVESLVYYRYQDDQKQFFDDWDESGASYATLETNRATFLVPEKDKSSILREKAVEYAVSLEFDVYRNGYGQIDENTAHSKHIAFLKSNEVQSASAPAPHYQEKELPAAFLDTAVSLKLSWNAKSKRLTYEMHPETDTANVIADTFTFQPEEELKSDQAYLMISAASGQAGKFAFELTSFENGNTTIDTFDELFARPLGNGVNAVADNKIVFTEKARQVGAVHTKNKIDLSQDFILNGIVTIAHDSDGLAISLHNDDRGIRAIGSNNGALGVFKRDNSIDYAGFSSIDEMLEFYDEFTEEFDEFIGLAYDTDDVLHQNVRTKFFVKADVHGAGAAYYGGEHTAQNGDTMSAYLSRNWLPIHEFGHGYEGRLARQELALVDVLNNVLAHYTEQTFKDPNSGGWMGKKQEIEREIAEHRNSLNNYYDYNQLDYRDRLYSLVNLLDNIGPKEAMAELHRINREVTKAGICYNTTDLTTKVFSEYSGKNVVPYFESWKLEVGNSEKANVFEKDFPILYYLRDCVGSDEKAVEIMNDLGCDGIYSLVAVDELKKYNLSGNLEISLSIDDFEQLKDKKIVIKNGEEIVKEIPITSDRLAVNDLPIGAYEIEIPNTKNKSYLYDYQYAVISAGETTKKEIQYRKDYNTVDSDLLVKMMGLGDWVFGSVTYDKTAGNLKVVTSAGQPHSYFNGKPYTKITVSDGTGPVYNREYIGDENYKNMTEEIPVSLGDKVTIWHAEASARLKTFGVLTNDEYNDYQAIDNTAEYIVTEYGLIPADFTEEKMYALYLERVQTYAELINERIPEGCTDNKNAYAVEKNLLKKSLELLKSKDREALETKYEPLLNGSKPVVTVRESQFKVGDVFEPASVFEAFDKEDGIIDLLKISVDLSNVPMQDGMFTKEGTYEVTYEVTDSDNHVVTGMMNLVVEKAVYTITVNGEAVASGAYNTKVTVKAPIVEGKEFTGWLWNDKVISTNAEYTFFISENMELTPCYEKVEVTPEALMTNTMLTKRADTKADVKFVGQLVVPEGYKVKNAGLVWSSKDDAELTIGSGAKITCIKAISNTDQFSVTIKGMPEEKFVRGRIFTTLIDAEGNEMTVYSDEAKMVNKQ